MQQVANFKVFAFQTLWSAILIYLYAWETSVQNKSWNGNLYHRHNEHGDENLFFKPPPTDYFCIAFTKVSKIFSDQMKIMISALLIK